MKSLELTILRKALTLIFKIRDTHPIPKQLDPPPQTWEEPYKELANECSLSLDLNDAFSEISNIFISIFQQDNRLI
jgi:hypothetical protein